VPDSEAVPSPRTAKLTPAGNRPDTVSDDVATPVAVTVKLSARPTENVALDALTIPRRGSSEERPLLSSEGPPTSAVPPSPASATLWPKAPAPISSLAVSLDLCWMQCSPSA